MTNVAIVEASKRTSELVLRSAKREDINVIFDLFSEVQSMHASAHPNLFREPVHDEKFEQFFFAILENPKQHLIFCCDGDDKVGYIQYSLGMNPENLFQPARTTAYINQLAVTKKLRGRGYGTKLVQHVKNEAIRRGVAQVELSVWAFNSPAQACFSKAGFKQRVSCMYVDI